MRKLTAANYARAVSFSALPKEEQALLRGLTQQAKKRRPGERGKQVAPTKQLVSLRLSTGVLEHFRSTGPGWQTRIDEILRRAVKRRPASRSARADV